MEHQRRRVSARRDLALVALCSVLAWVFFAKIDASETWARWTRPHEALQLDELPGVFLVAACGMVWFSSRRYFEAQRQLRLRLKAEARLGAALADNQSLALKYVDMQEHERKVLAHDLHDELGQYVNAIKLDAVSMRDALAGPPAWHATLRALIVNVDRVDEVLRGLIGQLRPVGFDDLGLIAALEHCIGEWGIRLPAARIEFSADATLESVDETVALVIFRLVQEAMTNIARHSAATRVDIQIRREDRGVAAYVADNGCGVDLALPKRGLGLLGMRERVSALGGSITVSAAPAAGFKISAFIPLEQAVS